MKTKPVIAIDLMGGDQPTINRLLAVKKFINTYPGYQLTVFIDDHFRTDNQGLISQLQQTINFEISQQVISMDESPLKALRTKQQSSMSLSMKAVAEKQADACLTAGNSGALVALSRIWLKTNPGIERPALVTVLPGKPKPTLFLDIGATLEYNAEELYALAEEGAAIAPQLLGCVNPEVALLNVGTEHIKGHDTVQQADRLLQQSDLNYLGFAEGGHLFKGYADVICCDGFVGNITLKACEGLLEQLTINQAKSKFKQWLLNKLYKINDVNFNPAQYNGALLLGLDGIVVKAHGNSNEEGFYHALIQSANYINKLKNQNLSGTN